MASLSAHRRLRRSPGAGNVDTEEGFAIIDCRDDGSFDYRYHEYGWDAVQQR